MNTKELRELLGKATPRPWAIYPGNNLGGDDSAGEYQQLIRNNKIHCPSDAALIVALVNNAEALLDEVDAWRQVWTALIFIQDKEQAALNEAESLRFNIPEDAGCMEILHAARKALEQKP